jgi:hypothetical protein
MDVRIDDRGKFFTPHVAKDTVRALVRTTAHMVVGQVYVRPDRRLKDELNAEAGRFLAVTGATVYDASGETMLYETSFLLVSYEHVILISPVEAFAEERPLWAQESTEEPV